MLSVSLAVGEIADAAAELASFGRIVVEKFGRAFILAHAHVAVVGNDGDDAVVAHLVHVIGGRENAGSDLGDGLRIVDLVARVTEGGQAEFVFDPFAKVAGAVRLVAGIGWGGVALG